MRSPAASVGRLDRTVPMSTTLLLPVNPARRHPLRAGSLDFCVHLGPLAVPPSARSGLVVARLRSDLLTGATP